MPGKSEQPSVAIPVVDIHGSNAAQEMLQAAVEYGFIFVKHQGLELTTDDVDDMFKLSKEFFRAPEHVKAECTINSASSGKNHGWLSVGKETLDPATQERGDFKEAFNLGEYKKGQPQQPLPSPLKPHAQVLGEFQASCHALCNQILELLAAGLEIQGSQGGLEWFRKRHDQNAGPSGSILRLLYYPALSEADSQRPQVDVRAGAHADYGSVTLLFRLPGQPGLEIKTRDDQWVPVPVSPTDADGPLPILVNIGDVLSYWTNGLLRSTVHRVVFPKTSESRADRYSIAYFCHPEDDAELEEIPSKVVQDHRQAYGALPPMDNVRTARDHLNARLAATYSI